MRRQRIVKFGGATPLTGVLTEPTGSADRSRPWVVLLNSGILHHVGVNRLHVQLAKRLADAGYGSLRFDFSGLGDSEARRDDLSFEQSAPLETKDAIDYLARSQGASGIVLMGLCSGADVAHLTAMQDERVVGLGLLDAWAYRTPMYFVHHYARRMVSLAAYRRWVSVRLERLRAKLRPAAPAGEDPEMYEMPTYLRVFPPRERVREELKLFVHRGIAMFLIFSGGLDEYNHSGQYRESFPEISFGRLLREAHVPDAAHVFSALHHQEFVVRELSRWVAERFGAAPAATATADGARERTA
jgi:pimeloyl-ACP methyl ester carboxylesterase